jgi:hypothetical protein
MADDWGLMEQWDEVPICTHCGHELEWVRCEQCEDGEIDVYELDPLWYDPGDTEPCTQCSGIGGWHWCYNAQCPAKREAA